MIGYVTMGSNDLARARAFYDELMPVIGAGRVMEFGDDFTMYGTGMGKPGLAVSNPYNGDPPPPAMAIWRRSSSTAAPRSTRSTPRRSSSAAPTKARPACAATKAPQAFYGAYFRDLDGNKLAAFRIGPAE